jgi:hypothetical protein
MWTTSSIPHDHALEICEALARNRPPSVTNLELNPAFIDDELFGLYGRAGLWECDRRQRCRSGSGKAKKGFNLSSWIGG